MVERENKEASERRESKSACKRTRLMSNNFDLVPICICMVDLVFTDVESKQYRMNCGVLKVCRAFGGSLLVKIFHNLQGI